MGIRGFSDAIQRYGVLSPLSGATVVIDGPALVHRISEACMKNRPPSSGFACLPPYELLSRLVIGWLDDLKSHNVNVRKIYFDGYLPPSKWDVRKQRLLRQSEIMRELLSSNPLGSAQAPGNAFRQLKTGLYLTDKGARVHNKTPKPPFLIPAVLEALRNDEFWGPLVLVVPGEADMFCARDIRENGGTLLTTDSDLLIQDLGLKGDMAFLWNIVLDNSPADEIGVKALKMSLHDINDRLRVANLGGLPRVAFEKQRGDKKGRDITFSVAVQNVRNNHEDVLNSPEYESFKEELELKEYVPSHHPVLSLLSDLDPRISEVIIQALLSKAAEPSTLEEKELRGPETLSIFLPILFENRNSQSAWTQSTNIRELAYGFLQILAPRKVEWIIEYRTLVSLTTHTGRQIHVSNIATIATRCTQLVALFEKLMENFSVNMQWLAFAVYRDIEHSTSEQQKILSATLVKEAASQPEGPKQYSWDLIHFTAQVQAQLYSLRIVKQVLDVVLVIGQGLPAPMQQLHNRLASLPLIAEWPTVESMFDLLSEFDKMGGLAKTAGILGIPENTLKNVPRDVGEETKKRKLKKLEKSEKQSENTRSFSVNPYSILGQTGQR